MPSHEPGSLWRWQLLTMAAGILALGVQTALLREFLVVLQGDEMAVGLGLMAWFVGIALGALLMRHGSVASTRSVAPTMLCLLGWLGYALVISARSARQLLGLSAFEPLSLAPSLLVAGCLFLLPGATVGSAFVTLATQATARFGSAHRSISNLYVFEAVGSLFAGILGSQILSIHTTPLQGLAWLLALAYFLAMPAARTRAIAGTWAFGGSGLLGLVLALSPLGTSLERSTERARFAALAAGSPLLASRSTPYQHVALGGTEPRLLYLDGQYVQSFPDPVENEVLAHELMLLSAHPRQVLSFGGIETGLLRFCLTHPVSTLDLVVLDAAAFELVRSHLEPRDRAALSDSRVHVIFEDPRRYLARKKKQYDLVLSLDPDPNTLYFARTTSREYYRLVRSRLAADGVYVTRFSTGPNVQTGALGLLSATLYRTLRDVFPKVLATPGPDSLLVAGNSATPVTIDATELTRRARERTIAFEAFLPEFLPELLPVERVEQINAELRSLARTAVAASDNHPLTFSRALAVRQSISGSSWGTLLKQVIEHPNLLYLAIVVPSSVLLLWQQTRSRTTARRRTAALHATAVTGASGLMLNLILLVSFQTRVAALYSQLGLLTGLFMLGLAMGGLTSLKHLIHQPLLRAQTLGAGLTFVVLCSLEFIDPIAPTSAWLWIMHIALLVLAGFSTGLLFPAASRECLEAGNERSAESGLQTASNLELWDHLGAAVAALVAALLVIPVLGLRRSVLALLVLQALAIWLTLTAYRATSSRSPG